MVHTLLRGTYADCSVGILIDSEIEHLFLSVSFVNDHNIPRNEQSPADATLAQYTIGGWLHSRLPLTMGFLTNCDVLLGADWLDACRADVEYDTIL